MTADELSVADHTALTRLIAEAAFRVDHGRADTLHELFTADATLTLGPMTVTGVDAIKAWGADRVTQRRTTRHVCTNLRLVATGPDTAAGTTVLTVYLHDGEGVGAAIPFAVSDYLDEFVRGDDGRWRFTSRATEMAFSGRG